MEIRFIVSEIRTGTVANGFGGCPAFLFCPLSLTRGNEVYHLTESCWPRRFVLQFARVSHQQLSFLAFISRGERRSISVNRCFFNYTIGFKNYTLSLPDDLAGL